MLNRSGLARLAGIAVLAAALCACGPQKAETPSDRTERGLSGNVRQVTMKLYYPPQAYGSVPVNRTALDLWMYSITVFDRDGFVSEERYFNRDNRLTSIAIHDRDKEGRPMGLTSRLANGDLELRLVYRYDDEGRRSREEYYDDNGLLTGSYDYRYDDRGRVESSMMEASYSDGSSRLNEIRYRYDASGSAVEEEYREQPSGDVMLRIAHAYRDGRRVYTSHYQRGRWLEGRVFYYYDPDGNLIKESSYQVPDDAEGRYDGMTREEDFPLAFFSSETRYEYRYFERD
ncbi:MAG: hypothetical protein E4H20_01550 [Spirochaetales bacterium]|nr:MAG: hypothetical protein E4H20_01550 [Spirochaetales bacterium]